MKKLFYLFTTAFIFLFTSCIDTGEKIALNEDGSGDYSITMDMSKMIGMMKQMGGGDKTPENKDTVVFFKPYVDTATGLTAEEKEILREGKVSLKVDIDKEEMKMIVDAPFKTAEQLAYLKENLPKMLEKIKLMDKEMDKGPMGDDNPVMRESKAPKAQTNPINSLYKFTSTANSLSYKLTNKEAAVEFMAKDSNLLMMKQMGPMMGELQYTTTLVLPRPVTKVTAANHKLSVDKKTVTIITTLSELFDKPDALEYEVEY